MKKILYLLLAVLILIGGVTIASARSLQAAVVLHNSSCWLPDASGSFEFEDLWYVPDCIVSVETNSQPSVKIIAFRGKLPEGALLPEKTIIYTYENTGGFLCFWSMEGPWTDQYHFIVTSSGHAGGYCVWKD